jgi:hypothetical protein
MLKYIFLLLPLFSCEAEPSAEEQATKPKQVLIRCKAKSKNHCTDAAKQECPNGYTVLLEQEEQLDSTTFKTYYMEVECK